ncbi:MAG: antitoxin [Acidobacteria bacterium]|nr:antitoxin [Acidobacteriota bacterium]
MMKLEKGSRMPIRITNPETEKIARKLASLTGESLASVINSALVEYYARIRRTGPGIPLREELAAIAQRCANRPIVSNLTGNQILGYDEFGAPTR